MKHFTVKSSSDLSTQFSVCLSSDNWKVVSACTEPQGDRKHILAGLDRLDNGRKKKNKCCQETIARGLEEGCSAYVCMCTGTQPWVKVYMFLHQHAYLWWRLSVYVCVSFHAPFMLRPCDAETNRLSAVKGHSLIMHNKSTTAVSSYQGGLKTCVHFKEQVLEKNLSSSVAFNTVMVIRCGWTEVA